MKNSITACCLLTLSILLGACQLPETEPKKMSSAAALQKTLIDSGDNVRVETWSTGSKKVNLSTEHSWKVSKSVLHGGSQENVDVVDLSLIHI